MPKNMKEWNRGRIPTPLGANEAGEVSVFLDMKTSTMTACCSPVGEPNRPETNAFCEEADYHTEHQKDSFTVSQLK